jgi:mRNA-degrading endonuclease RelE of RelBE toxin-antitoxin system
MSPTNLSAATTPPKPPRPRSRNKAAGRPHQKIIKAKLLIVAKNPEALKNNIRRIAGVDEALYRLRVSRYRIIFKKEEDAFVIIIIRIGHRKEVCLSMN